MVKPEDKKTREYNMFDYNNDKKLLLEEFDTRVPYLDVTDNRPKRQTVPGLDTDQVSYSPSRTERRGAGAERR